MSRRMVLWVLFASLAFGVGPAMADLPPPSGYLEKCTIENQRRPEEECQVCGAYFGERDRCEKELGTKGYEYRCKTYGASVWREIWCRPSVKAPNESGR